MRKKILIVSLASLLILAFIGFFFAYRFMFKKAKIPPQAENNTETGTQDGNRKDAPQNEEQDTDPDRDGLSYDMELKFGFDPNKADWNDKSVDSDGDRVSDKNEAVLRTDKNKKDTDGDGISDFYEVISGLQPLKMDFVEPSGDNDKDGLLNESEPIYGTSIFDADSDDDGYKDGQEVANGYNPMGAGRLPKKE